MARKILVLMVTALCFTMGAFAYSDKQKGKDPEKMWKELQEFKLKFLAQEMELKDEQKDRFIELYNEMSEKRRDVMMRAWNVERKVKKNTAATEDDYRDASQAMQKARDEDSAIEKSYDEKFSQFLSSKQIYKMKDAEQKFRQKMNEMRKNKERKHHKK